MKPSSDNPFLSRSSCRVWLHSRSHRPLPRCPLPPWGWQRRGRWWQRTRQRQRWWRRRRRLRWSPPLRNPPPNRHQRRRPHRHTIRRRFAVTSRCTILIPLGKAKRVALLYPLGEGLSSPLLSQGLELGFGSNEGEFGVVLREFPCFAGRLYSSYASHPPTRCFRGTR